MNVSQLAIKRRGLQLLAAAGLAALLFALLAPSAGAQGTPPPPHWLYGQGYHSDNGGDGEVRVLGRFRDHAGDNRERRVVAVPVAAAGDPRGGSSW